jgi:hypothetical protein
MYKNMKVGWMNLAHLEDLKYTIFKVSYALYCDGKSSHKAIAQTIINKRVKEKTTDDDSDVVPVAEAVVAEAVVAAVVAAAVVAVVAVVVVVAAIQKNHKLKGKENFPSTDPFSCAH